MSNDNNGGRVVELADLNVSTVRERNDDVDAHISKLEDRIDSLEDEKADLKAEKSSLEDERDGYREALVAFRDQKKQEAVETIESAADVLLPEEADASLSEGTLDDLSADAAQQVASVLDSAAQAQQTQPAVQNQAQADPGTVDNTDGATKAALAAADEVGMAEELQKLQAGEDLASPGPDLGEQAATQPQQSPGEIVEAAQQATAASTTPKQNGRQQQAQQQSQQQSQQQAATDGGTQAEGADELVNDLMGDSAGSAPDADNHVMQQAQQALDGDLGGEN